MKRRHFSHHKGPKQFQSPGQRVRAELGLTQDDLAFLLNVSRSAVAMDERGERSLPWPNVALLHALQIALAAPPTPETLLPLALDEADRDDLDFRRKGLVVETFPLEKKLERCRVRLAQAQRWQQVLPALRAAFPAADADAHAWLDRLEHRAERIRRSEGGAPALLQVRLAAIAFEMAEIARLLGEEPGA